MIELLLALLLAGPAKPEWYIVWWATPQVTESPDGNVRVECPPFPKGYKKLGVYDRRHPFVVPEAERPECYSYEMIDAKEAW